MVIIKFALAFFLVYMVLMVTLRQGQGPLQGGPYFFLEMPGNRNPVKPRLRLNGWQAYHRKNVWRVWFNNKGLPVDMRLYRDGSLAEREELLYDKTGRPVSRRFNRPLTQAG